ncbi:TadE-like protein [Pseudobythopirellula maris]|uniref:TadE-like protein n=1 Tax=Pseudobythopirellula maris TaxID=2527991 RepID=A0A5C5ZLZ9_9BACT|nr:TadE/TadG family type IV pilus assembly protein [Pseudobythopirellula maris]TWT88170.1 TadE-like protein [Pseudobythopirellula maris]
MSMPLLQRRRAARIRDERAGTTIVETAFVLPVFLIFVLGIVELGNALMVQNTLRSACRAGARYGSTEGRSTAEVKDRIEEIMAASVDVANLSLFIKDADTLDTPQPQSPSGTQIEALPDIELGDTDVSRLFVVRGTVGYNELAIIPMTFMEGVTLSTQIFMRHE